MKKNIAFDIVRGQSHLSATIKRRDYGKKDYIKIYHGAAAERDLCIWQQSQRYAWRWRGIYRLP